MIAPKTAPAVYHATSAAAWLFKMLANPAPPGRYGFHYLHHVLVLAGSLALHVLVAALLA